ncbi:MAG: hypothetical protein Q9192_000938 [Flavoplaca navasiana]
MTAISPAAPSQPVVIPTRTKTNRRHSKQHVQDESLVVEDHGASHDSQALSPSAAAFFAIKSLRDAKDRSGTGIYPGSRPNHVNNGQMEANERDTHKATSSASSLRSWRLLLSAPEELEDMDGPFASGRSLSSESMPSLETDTDSAYTSSSPSTPGLPRRGSGLREKRPRSTSSSVPEVCHSDHPLLVDHSEHEHIPQMKPGNFAMDESKLSRPSRLSLRSNLTASLRRLKYAAQNISSLGTAVTSRDDVQAPATLSGSSRFADERRPLPWAEPPHPALRRYLNPITVSPAEFYSHGDHEKGTTSPRVCTASIQMQTYQPGARKSENATAPPVFVVASPRRTPVDEPAVSASQRHREPRENSDFLRVIVLEMNMRKVGKLSDGTPGRARLWLPARRSPTLGEDVSGEKLGRWTSMNA